MRKIEIPTGSVLELYWGDTVVDIQQRKEETGTETEGGRGHEVESQHNISRLSSLFGNLKCDELPKD